MPPTAFVDQSGATPGTSLNASSLNGLVVMDTTEAATNDSVSASNTFWANLDRIRFVLAAIQSGAWNAATAMIPLAQKGAASGVLTLSAQSLPNLRNGGTPTVAVGANAGTGATASVNAGSTDACGVITINTGTGTTGGTYATVTFSTTLAAAPKLVLLGLVGAQLTNAPASGSYTTTSFVITANMAASTTFQVGYLVIP